VLLMNRREVLKGAIAAGALPMAGGAAEWVRFRGAERVEPRGLAIHKVIVDQRVAEASSFGYEMSRRGLAVHPTDGDITRLWTDDLYLRWRKAPVAIAGLTAHGPLFCLERLSWDFGMRVVMRADYRRAAPGAFAQALIGLASLEEASAGARLADAETDTLIAWVIAPVGRPLIT
jgi:hypothetical protein